MNAVATLERAVQMTSTHAAQGVIVCAVDGGLNACPVAYAAAGIALQLDTRLVLVRADARVAGADVEAMAAQQDLEQIERQCASGPTGGRLRARLELQSGDPGNAVRLQVARHKPLLVVMGTRRRSWLRRSLFGSMAHSLMCHLDVPLVVVPPNNPEVFEVSPLGARPHLGSVLVPLDFGPSTAGQIEFASRFVRGTSTRVVLLHVSAPREAGVFGRMSEAKARLAHPCCDEVLVREGRPQAVLEEMAASGDFGLVVLGRDRHRAGAIASNLLTLSNALVAIVP